MRLGQPVKRQQLLCFHGNNCDAGDIAAAITLLEFGEWREIKVQPDYGVSLIPVWVREREAAGQSELF